MRAQDKEDQALFVELITRNRVINVILERLDDLAVPDTWLIGGCLFQTVWNCLLGLEPGHGIKDYDIFYFDGSDLSWEAEDRVIRRGLDLFADLDVEIEIRNQARVHLWYPARFGVKDYPALTRATDGIDHFLTSCSMVGVRPAADGGLCLYAPLGLRDILTFKVRPNPGYHYSGRKMYEAKTARWTATWPDIEVLPWGQSA